MMYEMASYPINNILVPIDMSEASLNALDTAMTIARSHNASVIILHVRENYIFPALEGAYGSGAISHSSDILHAISGAVEHAYGITPLICQEEGHVSDIIIRMCLMKGADLIVMGKNGASGTRDEFIGSNTYCTIKHAACPVLSVPNRKKINSFNRILFPIRPVSHALSSYEVVSALTTNKTQLDILGLSYRGTETDTGILQTLAGEISEQLERDDVDIHFSWGQGGQISDDVIRHAQTSNADLIIVTHSLDANNKPRYIGPHTQKIVNCARTSVLCLKNIRVPLFA